jgi:hypothetical protein
MSAILPIVLFAEMASAGVGVINLQKRGHDAINELDRINGQVSKIFSTVCMATSALDHIGSISLLKRTMAFLVTQVVIDFLKIGKTNSPDLILAQKMVGSLCQLIALVSSVALIFFGHLALGVTSTSILVLGFIDFLGFLPTYISNPIHEYTPVLREYTPVLRLFIQLISGNLFIKLFSIYLLAPFCQKKYSAYFTKPVVTHKEILDLPLLEKILKGTAILEVNPYHLSLEPSLPVSTIGMQEVKIENLMDLFNEINFDNRIDEIIKNEKFIKFAVFDSEFSELNELNIRLKDSENNAAKLKVRFHFRLSSSFLRILSELKADDRKGLFTRNPGLQVLREILRDEILKGPEQYKAKLEQSNFNIVEIEELYAYDPKLLVLRYELEYFERNNAASRINFQRRLIDSLIIGLQKYIHDAQKEFPDFDQFQTYLKSITHQLISIPESAKIDSLISLALEGKGNCTSEKFRAAEHLYYSLVQPAEIALDKKWPLHLQNIRTQLILDALFLTESKTKYFILTQLKLLDFPVFDIFSGFYSQKMGLRKTRTNQVEATSVHPFLQPFYKWLMQEIPDSFNKIYTKDFVITELIQATQKSANYKEHIVTWGQDWISRQNEFDAAKKNELLSELEDGKLFGVDFQNFIEPSDGLNFFSAMAVDLGILKTKTS